ncbi:RagB/SusD family nutrient uptake outer membrane protein [Parabacteroides pacaensis]|uniref:RagB/SusD family nutrient uptake outer membrane protein n=1 Tax=Parabacteroides pacaensis TaxID=2086575 RepID=UPI0018FE8D0B|nr:RagB/SusD family nutrient uptake outer membrane protein [Parabacteroides pacaensis]
MKKKLLFILSVLSIFFSSCADFLDVVPEGVSQLENAFSRRQEAEKYLYTCYTYLPKDGDVGSDPALWGDEMWTLENALHYDFSLEAFNISRGLQNARSPLINNWDHYYRALRDCNIFIENVVSVPDLPDWEKKQWVAEAKFLKAYYHFMLVRMYGPVPLVRENLPIDASQDAARVFREPVDSCFAYIVQLLDEAKDDLPLSIANPVEELGRITAAIAYSLKAKVLVTAASPLYNGNTDQVSLINTKSKEKIPLFNQTKSMEKWIAALTACKDAVDLCEGKIGMKLYEYPGDAQYNLSDTIIRQMSLRGAFCERWTSELIWANTQSVQTNIQLRTSPKLDPEYQNGATMTQALTVPLQIAEQFYTDHGVPVAEDKTFDYTTRYNIQTAGIKDQLYIRRGAKTVKIHFNREPRFYAWLGFDAGVWYGQKNYDDKKPDDLFYVQGRKGQVHGSIGPDFGPITGYIPKKYVHYKNVQNPGIDNYSINTYPWPLLRLADLYLLYAEALNEAADTEENKALAISYVDKIRKRAGLEGVKDAWTNYSTNSGKFKSQVGLREIIRQERLIELAFEGQRFWDMRRWKTVIEAYRTPIQGWDLNQREPQYYYRKKVVSNLSFGLKDYFWPISNGNITVNPNLEQNIGW